VPSSSAAQHKLMEIAAHTPGGYGGVPQKVGQDFAAADAGRPKGSPKSRTDHMAAKAKHTTHAKVAEDFGVHRSTVSRAVKRKGYRALGSAKA
jgi:hypothetical protein